MADAFVQNTLDTFGLASYVGVFRSTPKKIPCTRILFCLVRTGANFAILVEMKKFKFSKKNKESKLI